MVRVRGMRGGKLRLAEGEEEEEDAKSRRSKLAVNPFESLKTLVTGAAAAVVGSRLFGAKETIPNTPLERAVTHSVDVASGVAKAAQDVVIKPAMAAAQENRRDIEALKADASAMRQDLTNNNNQLSQLNQEQKIMAQRFMQYASKNTQVEFYQNMNSSAEMEAQNRRTPAFTSDPERVRLQAQFAQYADPVNGTRDAAELFNARQNQANQNAFQQGSNTMQVPMTTGMYNASQIIPGSQPPSNHVLPPDVLGTGNYNMGGLLAQPTVQDTGYAPMDLSGEGLRRRRSKLRKAF
jgi:hypothetical protein